MLFPKHLLLILVSLFVLKAAATEKLPVEAFASLPDLSSFKLSPSGEQVLFIGRYSTEEGDGTLVNLFNLNTGERSYVVQTDNKKFQINWVDWASDDKVLVSAVFPAIRYGTPTTESRLMVKDLKTGKLRSVLSKSFYRGLDRIPQFQDNVIDILPDDPDHILLSVSREQIHTATVYKINLKNLKRKSYSRSKNNVDEWITDQQHRVRAGLYWKDTDHRVYVKGTEEKAKWRELTRFESFSEDQVWPLGFDLDPNILYFIAYHEGKKAIFKTDLRSETFTRELVFYHENYDVTGNLLYSKISGEVIGIQYSNEGGYHFFDDEYEALQNGIDKALPDTENAVISMSADETRYVVKATSQTEAGVYYVGDRKAKSLSRVGRAYTELKPELMVEKVAFEYQARDGLNIEAFLSKPKSAEDKPLPTLIFPHGGPISFDDGGFDYWTQFFANRGYAVLQMNFRGSSGYGYDFMKAGLQNWGQAMQDDVEDGARALIDRGIADPEKICIVGASYGGYAALMGAVKTPDLYQCAVSFAGVTDVAYMVAASRRYTNYEVVKEQVGSNRKLLKQVSPVNHVDKIEVPVLLVHGDKDRSVRVKHSRMMNKRLQKAGKAVTYLEIENGDHFLSKNEHRIATFKAMDQFFAKHLPVTP